MIPFTGPLFFVVVVFFSFSLIVFVTDYLAPMRSRILKLCIYLECGQLYCGKENHDALIYFCLLSPFFLFFHLSLPSSVRPSSVLPSVRPSTFSNDFSSEADSFHILHIASIGGGNGNLCFLFQSDKNFGCYGNL